MQKFLIIDSAATGDASVSRNLTGKLAGALTGRGSAASIIRRDVGTDVIPHLTPDTVPAIKGGEIATEAGRAALALSNDLIAEIEDADVIVIGAPMYNFGMSSTLKTWFDHVLRAGATFRYTADGPEGLVRGKRAIVIESRAGSYDGPGAVLDHQEGHIRTLLAFMGITEVEFVRVEKLVFGPDAAAAAIADATTRLGTFIDADLALAA